MLIMKKFLLILLCCISIFIFSGCAEVQYTRYFYQGIIIDDVFIELDDTQFSSTTKLNLVKNKIANDINQFKTDVDSLKSTLVLGASLEYRDYIINGIEVTKEIDHVKSKYRLITKFADYNLFVLFYGTNDFVDCGPFTELIMNTGKSNAKLIDDFWIKYKSYVSDNSITAPDDLNKNSTELMYESYYELYTGQEFNGVYDFSQIDFSQVFKTDEDRFYSNADIVVPSSQTTDGLTWHYWSIDSDTKQLEIYRLSPYTTSWYVVALAISIISIIIMIIVMIVKKKNSNNLPNSDMSYNILSNGEKMDILSVKKKYNKRADTMIDEDDE